MDGWINLKRIKQGLGRPLQSLTYIWCECNGPVEYKEGGIRHPIHKIPAIHLRQWSNKQWSQTQTQYKARY